MIQVTVQQLKSSLDPRGTEGKLDGVHATMRRHMPCTRLLRDSSGARFRLGGVRRFDLAIGAQARHSTISLSRCPSVSGRRW